ARNSGTQAKFIELAGEINSFMPQYVVNRVSEAMNSRAKPIQGSRIGVLGVSYKKNVGDTSGSPSIKVMELLLQRGAEVFYSDPHVQCLEGNEFASILASQQLSSQSSPLTKEFLTSLDCTIIVTDHDQFDWEKIVQESDLIVDSRNATAHVTTNRDKIWPA
ncbi:MAG: UDP binding domain-containing protein, partial [Planctomycetota bacterium]